MIRDTGGGVFELDGARQLAFPGFTGELLTVETGSLGIVWPVAANSARRLVVKRFTNPVQRLTDGPAPGFFAFEQFREEPLVFGEGFPLVLTFERPYPGGYVGNVAYLVWLLLRNCGVQVRTTRPAMTPGDYGQAVIGCDLWQVGAAGLCSTTFPRVRGGYDPSIVHFRGTADPAQTAVGVVHESCHAWLGPEHTNRSKDVRVAAPGPVACVYPEDEAAIKQLTNPWRV